MAALGLGMACLVGALMVTDLRDRHALSSRGERAAALVVRVEHDDRNARHLWLAPRFASYPVLRFTTADGRAVEIRGTDQVDATQVWPGQRLPVVYDPSEPTRARVAAQFDADRGWRPWVLAPFLVLGVVLAAVALVWPGRLRRP